MIIHLVTDLPLGTSESARPVPPVVSLHVPSTEPLKIRADIMVTPYHDQLKHYVDVTIANPAAPSYRTLFNSSMVAGATARGRERSKWEKYVHVDPRLREHATFSPFAVETSGSVIPYFQFFR